jgi:hypothetical protein
MKVRGHEKVADDLGNEFPGELIVVYEHGEPA